MTLRRLVFKNFKALADVAVTLDASQDSDDGGRMHSRFTVLVGPNGSGKSTVLQGAHYLSQMTVPQREENESKTGRPGMLFRKSRDPRRLVTAPGTGPLELTAEMEDGRSLLVRADLPAEDDDRGKVTFHLEWGNEHNKLELDLPEGRGEAATAFFRDKDLRSLGSAVLLRLDPRRLAAPSYSETATPRVEHDGHGLPSVLADLASTDPSRHSSIEKNLRAVVSYTGQLQTPRAEIVRPERETILVDDRPIFRTIERSVWGNRLELHVDGVGFVPGDLLSDGTLLSLGLLTVLHAPACPKLVLLDDLDRGLHPRAQRQLIECLRRVLALEDRSDLQIVCTSHSPFILDCVAPEEVRIMNLDKHGHAHCRNLNAHPEWPRWRELLKAGEFWSSVGEDWLLDGASQDAG